MPLIDSVSNFQKHWLERTFDEYDQTTQESRRREIILLRRMPIGVPELFGITLWGMNKILLRPIL